MGLGAQILGYELCQGIKSALERERRAAGLLNNVVFKGNF